MEPGMEELKAKGNEHIKAGEFEEAVKLYTAAIAVEETAALYSNRSNAYLKLNKHYEAFADAQKAIQLQPLWSKGYFRRGEVQLIVGQYQEAMESYQIAYLLHHASNGQPDSLITSRTVDAREKFLWHSKFNKYLPWVAAGVGLIVAVIIIVADYTLTKTPSITHVLLQSLFVMVFSGIGGGIGKVWVWYNAQLLSTKLQPTLKQESEEGSQQLKKNGVGVANGDVNRSADDNAVTGETPTRQHQRYTKAQARQRFKKGKL